MHAILCEVLGNLNAYQINQLCLKSGVPRPTVDSWMRLDRRPRLDLVDKIVDAAGYKITLRRKELVPMTPRAPATPARKLHITIRNGRVELWDQTKMLAYVEDDILHGIDRDGYAVQIGTIGHRVEIIPKFEEWRDKQP